MAAAQTIFFVHFGIVRRGAVGNEVGTGRIASRCFEGTADDLFHLAVVQVDTRTEFSTQSHFSTLIF